MVKWDAEAYKESSHEQFKWGIELLDKLALKRNESVLDIGCGDGKLTIEIAKKVPNGHVVGIDNSKEMISFAKKNFTKDRYPNIDWQLMDATEINFDNKFDAAYSNAVLHWVKDHVAVLRGVKKSLKTKGRILFQMAGKGNALNAAQALISVISKERWSKYFIYGVASSLSYYEPDDYRVWLKELGFIEKRVELFPKDASFQGREGMRGNIKSVWMPFTDKIPEDIRDEFVEDIIDEFGERFPPDEQGYYHFNMMRLEVEAGKT